MKLIEVVIALVLGVMLLLGTWHQATSVRHRAEEADSIVADWEARRVAGLALDLDAEGVVGVAGPNEVTVRAFRWWGLPCAAGRDSVTTVLATSGARQPDASKDSLLAIDGEGRSKVLALVRTRRSTACGVAATEISWAPSEAFRPVLVRGFERGAYRVDAAFRYRRGAGGAQPLTATRLDADSVALRLDSARLELELAPLPKRVWVR